MRGTFNSADKGNIQGFISAINTKCYVICNTEYVRGSSPQQCCTLRIISDTNGDVSVHVRARAYRGKPHFPISERTVILLTTFLIFLCPFS
jgi:hypothetical protein